MWDIGGMYSFVPTLTPRIDGWLTSSVERVQELDFEVREGNGRWAE